MERTKPGTIAAALFPVTRQRVLALLYGRPDQEFHLREIARRTGLAPATVQREMANLAAEIVSRRVEGRQVHYGANPACPVFAELRGLAIKELGVTGPITGALADLGEKAQVAFLFGSMADGEARADSDVDLLVGGRLPCANSADPWGVRSTQSPTPQCASSKLEHKLQASSARP